MNVLKNLWMKLQVIKPERINMPVFNLTVHNADVETDGNNTIIHNISLEEINSLLREAIAYESISVLSSECHACRLDTADTVFESFYDSMTEQILLTTEPEKTSYRLSFEGGCDE